MWAQYGEQHAGVCLIFDRGKLHDCIKKAAGDHSELFFGKVNYRNLPRGHRREGNPFLINCDELRSRGIDPTIKRHIRTFYKEIFLEKAVDWRDEFEYRWIIRDKSYEQLFVPFEDALRGIVVGPDFPTELNHSMSENREKYGVVISEIRWQTGVPSVVPRI